MARDADIISFKQEQGGRARKLFAAVVLAALDDAVREQHKTGRGCDDIARWARSRDGQLVLSSAGIEINERTIDGLIAFVRRGVRPAAA